MKIANLVANLALCALVACSSNQPPEALSKEESALASSLGFDATLLVKLKSRGDSYERFVGENDSGDAVPAAGVALVTKSGSSQARLRQLRLALSGTGYSAWLFEDSFGLDRPTKIAVMRTSDEFVFLKLAHVSAPNYDITHDQVIAKYIELRERLGLELIGANIDWMSARITRPPADWQSLAAELYEFCPDIVDQGTGTVTKLAAEMRREKELFLWWD